MGQRLQQFQRSRSTGERGVPFRSSFCAGIVEIPALISLQSWRRVSPLQIAVSMTHSRQLAELPACLRNSTMKAPTRHFSAKVRAFVDWAAAPFAASALMRRH